MILFLFSTITYKENGPRSYKPYVYRECKLILWMQSSLWPLRWPLSLVFHSDWKKIDTLMLLFIATTNHGHRMVNQILQRNSIFNELFNSRRIVGWFMTICLHHFNLMSLVWKKDFFFSFFFSYIGFYHLSLQFHDILLDSHILDQHLIYLFQIFQSREYHPVEGYFRFVHECAVNILNS